MLTKILTGVDPIIEVVTPLGSRSKQKTTVLLTVDGQDTKLEVRFGVRVTEHEDPWAVRLRALRRGMLLYRSLWEVLCGSDCDGVRELPEPLQERFSGSDYLVYRDAGKGVEIRVQLMRQWELVCEQELQYEQHCQYEEYQDDCLTVAEAAVRAYEDIIGQQLELMEGVADD